MEKLIVSKLTFQTGIFSSVIDDRLANVSTATTDANLDDANAGDDVKLPTSVYIDMFSGFEFQSLTSLDLMGENMNAAVPGGFNYVEKNQFLTIFLKQVNPSANHSHYKIMSVHKSTRLEDF